MVFVPTWMVDLYGNPGMSSERDYPYIPILRMGLEPSILF